MVDNYESIIKKLSVRLGQVHAMHCSKVLSSPVNLHLVCTNTIIINWFSILMNWKGVSQDNLCPDWDSNQIKIITLTTLVQ